MCDIEWGDLGKKNVILFWHKDVGNLVIAIRQRDATQKHRVK